MEILLISIIVLFILVIIHLHLRTRIKRQSQKLLLKQILEIENATFWRYNIKQNLFCTEQEGSIYSDIYDLESFIKFFKTENRSSLTNIFNNLKSGSIDTATYIGEAFDYNQGCNVTIKIHMKSSPVNGEVVYIIGTLNILSEEECKRLNDERKAHEYESIFNDLPYGVCIFNADGVLIDINRFAQRAYGFDDKDLLDLDKTALKNNIVGNFWMQKRDSKTDENPTSNIEESIVELENGYILERRGEQYFLNKIFTETSVADGSVRYVLSFCEISKDTIRKVKQEEYNEEKTLLLESLPIGVAIYDNEGYLVYSNDMYCDILGISEKELFLSNHNYIFDNPILREDQIQKIITSDSIKFDVLVKSSDPKFQKHFYSNITDEKTLELNSRRSYTLKGEKDCFIIIISDITEVENQHKKIGNLNKTMASLMSAGNLSAWAINTETNEWEVVQENKAMPYVSNKDEYLDNIHPDDAPHFMEIIERIKRGEIDDFRTVIRYRNTSIKEGYMYLDFIGVVEKENGKIKKFACINRDVTEQTIYRQKLERSRIRTMLTFEGGDITQFDYNVKQDILTAFNNNIIEQGIKEASIDEFLNMVHRDDVEKIFEYVNHLKNGDDVKISLDFRLKTVENIDWHFMHVTIVPLEKDASGKVLLYTGICRNNTEICSTLAKLEESNLLLSAVVNRMPCMFFMKDVDDDYRYILANDWFCNELGRTRNNVLGLSDYEIFSGDEAEATRFRKDDMEAVEMGLKSISEETVWAEGRKVWHTTKSLLVTNSGHRFMLGMSLDITVVDKTLEDLKQAKENAERSDLLKSKFLANMSHEIRTPLNSIVGFADILVNTDDPVRKAECEKIILSNSDQLLVLINDILDMSKIEAGFIDLKIEQFDVTEMLSNLADLNSKSMKKNVKFIFVNPFKHCIIESDKQKLTQVINNYISNAIKYTSSGYIELGYSYLDGGLKVYVEDTGIGISEEKKDLVFERFEKLDMFTPGTGLGLPISKAIINTLNGHVGFDSHIDAGSNFWFWIPCKAEINEDIHIEDNNSVTPKQDKKHLGDSIDVLAVEDNDSNYSLIKAILLGYNVSRAVNGLEAINMVKVRDFSIVLMDLKMPVMGGLEATQKIREFNKTIPIIALSANAFESDRIEALNAGCNNYMAKPLKRENLLNLMSQYI